MGEREQGRIRAHPEFDPERDVFRGPDGQPVTITEQQLAAIWHAVDVVSRVRQAEGHRGFWDLGHTTRAELAKSRLLGRMLLNGRPPTRTRPPVELSGPAWELLPGGDPFAEA